MRWEGDKGGRAPCTSLWTAEKDAVLCRLWPDRDLSCPQIAVEIGGGATKNAVIGRARRLKLGPKPRSSEAKQRGQADGAATKRARSERQRVVSGQALAERRERQAAIGLAVVAKVEAEAAAAQRRAAGLRKFYHLPKNAPEPVEDNCPDDIAVDLPPRRYRPVLAATNPGVVKPVERDPDLYAHMRTAEQYSGEYRS